MNTKPTSLLAPILIGSLLSACAEIGVPRYTPSEVGVALNSERVKIVQLRRVTVNDVEPGGATLAGGIAGGVAGSMIGSGKASVIGAVGGALAGLVLGKQAEKKLGGTKALEITFLHPSGRESIIVQPDNGEVFVPGEEVRWITSGRSGRITH
jgi:outer membrane lipoprotein SlyB